MSLRRTEGMATNYACPHAFDGTEPHKDSCGIFLILLEVLPVVD